jgi:hypothetical protein
VSECASLPVFSPAHQDRVSSQGNNGQVPSFRREILCSLREHPEAQDTVEGIIVCWVSERAIKHWLPQVRGSRAALVNHGYLEKRKSVDGRVFHRANPSRPTRRDI